MELSYEEVLEILELLEHSDVEYLNIEIGATKLVASKSGMALDKTPEPRPYESPSIPDEPLPSEVRMASQASSAAAGKSNEAPVDASLVPVLAPVVGVFFRQSEPGASPYTEIGDHVDEGSTLGLMEVMKMFASVTSPVKGEVVQILIENAEFVEFEQPLMLIRPETQI